MMRPFTRAALMIGLLVSLAAGSLWLRGREQTDLPPLSGPLVRLQHSSGLYMDVPSATVDGELTATGIRLRPRDSAELRRPWSLDVALAPSAGATETSMRSWSMGGRTLRQTPVVSTRGGSGGDQHMVSAWFACGDGYVVARYSQQADDPQELDLAPAWQLVLSSGCPAGGTGRP